MPVFFSIGVLYCSTVLYLKLCEDPPVLKIGYIFCLLYIMYFSSILRFYCSWKTCVFKRKMSSFFRLGHLLNNDFFCVTFFSYLLDPAGIYFLYQEAQQVMVLLSALEKFSFNDGKFFILG